MTFHTTATIRVGLIAMAAAAGSLSLPVAARGDAKIYQQTLRSTAWVTAKANDATATGSGVLVDRERKLVVTNSHVVGEARAVVVYFPELQNGKPVVSRQNYLHRTSELGIAGQIVAIDRLRDLALIQLERLPEHAQAIALASSSPQPGEAIESIGNPSSSEALWVYTSGTVRAVYKKQFRSAAGQHDFTLVETQSPINTGDSGGPVVNSAGELVAVSQAIAANARLVSYAVDVSEVKQLLASAWKSAPAPLPELLAATGLEFRQHASGQYEVRLDQSGKQHPVFISSHVECYERADMRRVWGLAAALEQPPKLDVALKLLEQNSRTKLGAWGIEQSRSGDYLVIYCVKLDASASPAALKSAIQYVGRITAAGVDFARHEKQSISAMAPEALMK